MSYKFEYTDTDLVGRFCEAEAQMTVLAGERDAAQQLAGRLIAERDAARYETASLRATMPVAESELRTQLATVTIERDSLRTQVSTLAANQTDVETEIVTRLCQMGIRKTAVTFPDTSTAGTTKATEQSPWRSGANLTELAAAHIAATGYKPPQP